MKAAEAFAAAMRHHQAGQLADAERLYRAVLAAEPGHLHALALAGALAHMGGRNEEAADLFGRALAISEQPDFHYNTALAKWALGRRAEAIAHWERALALNPDFAQAHMNLGNALREDGRAGEAVMHLRRALQLQPSPFAHNNLGLALAGIGDGEAAGHFRRAIEMHPGFVEPHLNLALDLARQGDVTQALAFVRRSLQIRETPDNKALFVRLAADLDAIGNDQGLRELVTRAVSEDWGPTSELVPLVATLIRHGSPIENLLRRAETASGFSARDLAPADLAVLADDSLLRWMLESATLYEFPLERVLTAARTALLTRAEADAVTDRELRFCCALARQCFINEYVYAADREELARAARLGGALAGPPDGGAARAARIAVVAAYHPLHTLPGADALLAQPWPEPVAALFDQQVRAPRAEAASRATVPQLTPIDDEVSRLVREQYEHNPYPRWFTVGSPRQYESIDALMQRERPHATFSRLGKGGDLDILVAGCGTGRQPIVIARQFERARVLAVDLSAASLGYAKARADELGVNNIEFGQGDLLRLGSLGRTFDVIYAGGVLHHLGDPWAGWRTLLSLLRPNGFMHVALYSETARRDIVRAREFITERRYGSTPEEIRACRQELMSQDDASPLKNVVLFNDFFTTSECRDLLFHVREHRMTLPAIKQFLVENDMQFLGFDPLLRPMRHYAARFPDDKAMVDLDRWHAFEQDNPYTFASMYCFWVQKA